VAQKRHFAVFANKTDFFAKQYATKIIVFKTFSRNIVEKYLTYQMLPKCWQET